MYTAQLEGAVKGFMLVFIGFFGVLATTSGYKP